MIDRFNYQTEFTREVITSIDGKFPASQEDKVKWTKEYILYIISECNDLLNQLDWKTHWSNREPVIKDNIGIELIDIQKFVWGLFKIWDIDSDNFLDFFDLKTEEVRNKWDQEIMKSELFTKDNICVIDIDGVLSPYPESFTNWVKQYYSICINKEDPIIWEKCKDLYRQSGGKRYIPAIKDSISSLIALKNKGYTIVLLTNRPAGKYKRIYSDTLFWLRSNKVPFDYIFWAEDKKILSIINICKNIDFVVDDTESTCHEFRNYGIKTYQYGKDIKSLLDIEELK